MPKRAAHINNALDATYKGKKILVTGGTGSIGSAIVRKVLEYSPEVVRIFSNDEDAQFSLQQALKSHDNVRSLIGDIRDKERLTRAIEGVDIVFHAAALKHVPLCEYNPFEAVKTNVLGTQNLIEAALGEEVEKVITISTDKAVNPINVMGATKLLAERVTVAANLYRGGKRTVFSCMRFGNVLDSRGSVIPLFRSQIQHGGPVTITDADMTRFVISIPKAVELILKAVGVAQGGEVFVIKMSVLRVGDLAEAMIEELAPKYGHKPTDIRIQIIGKRPGEKNHEDLMSEEEALCAYETDDMFVVTPQIADYVRPQGVKPMSCVPREGRLLSKREIKELCRQEGLF